MISRRQIIENQQELRVGRGGHDARNQVATSNGNDTRQQVARTIKENTADNSKRKLFRQHQQQQVSSTKQIADGRFKTTSEHDKIAGNQDFELDLPEEMLASSSELKCFQDRKQQQQQHYDRSGNLQRGAQNNFRKHELQERTQQDDINDSSDEREDECTMMMMMRNNNGNNNNNNLHHEDYRHFDPYSVYGEEDEEEDVWYSEERLFEVSLRLLSGAHRCVPVGVSSGKRRYNNNNNQECPFSH